MAAIQTNTAVRRDDALSRLRLTIEVDLHLDVLAPLGLEAEILRRLLQLVLLVSANHPVDRRVQLRAMLRRLPQCGAVLVAWETGVGRDDGVVGDDAVVPGTVARVGEFATTVGLDGIEG